MESDPIPDSLREHLRTLLNVELQRAWQHVGEPIPPPAVSLDQEHQRPGYVDLRLNVGGTAEYGGIALVSKEQVQQWLDDEDFVHTWAVRYADDVVARWVGRPRGQN